ncbi:MAG: LacI family transcriptional regulator [Rariglobus sp.]|jgi:LacI family transcriptional regulator|nr:LacI family transcriptional regulator [Rariglobus sp.]
MKGKASTVSLGDIAREAGVSRVAVCYALRNSPGVSPATRKRVVEISKRLGYVPDARIASWMASVRDSKKKDLLPLAWLNTIGDTKTWRQYEFLSPFIEGAQERALHLGYRIDEIWTHQPGMSMARISRMLFQRGIEGVIVTYPATHIRLDWKRFVGVAIGGSLLAPRLHRVMADHYYNLLLALKMLKRHGYRRIGICIEQAVDCYSAHTLRAAAVYFQATTPKANQIPPLFYLHRTPEDWPAAKTAIMDWLSINKPDVVVCQSSRMLACVEEAGYRVPEQVGVVHLATDDDVADWAGVSSNRRMVGATAVELAVSLVRNRQFGVPEMAPDTTIRGSWHPGRTLLIPKPK